MEAAQHLKILLFIGLLYPFAYQFGTVVDSIEKSKLNFYYSILHALILIVLLIILIPTMGIFGTSLSLVLSYVIIIILQLYYLNRKFNITITSILKQIIIEAKGFYNLKNKLF